jgi:hypothetical protein
MRRDDSIAVGDERQVAVLGIARHGVWFDALLSSFWMMV